MRVAAVGSGIFGVGAAVHWARPGHQGALVESQGDIFQAAFHVNEYRLRRGFHYARSPETIRQGLQAERIFRDDYGQVIVRSDPDICADAVAAVFRVQEERLDYARPKAIHVDRIRPGGVGLRLNRPFVRQENAWFDQVVTATHVGMHSVAWEGYEPLLSQFEVCEKTAVRLSRSARKKSIVVLDGPFMCVDPLGRSERHVRGNVVPPIHSANVGHHPGVPPPTAPLWNREIVSPPPCSRFQKFIDAGLLFLLSTGGRDGNREAFGERV